MTQIKNVVLASKSTFTATVQKVGGRVTATDPITVKNQIQEIRSLDDIPGVNTSMRTDGATIVYNANTNQYDVRPTSGNVVSIAIQTLQANGTPGTAGQVLHTNGSTIYWSPTLTANNATFAYGKREGDLSVNFASFAGNANFAFQANVANFASVSNTATFAFGKRESDLSVNFASFAGDANFAYTANLSAYATQANNSTFAYGKREGDLSVNFASFSGNGNFAFSANNSTYAYGKSEGALNVNSALYAVTAGLANTSVVPGTYGNGISIPVITVDQYGRINAVSVSTSSGVGITGYSYNSSNNTFTIAAGDAASFNATIDVVKDFTVTGNLTVSGTTTTVNTQNLTVKDPVITLNDGQLTPFNDIGLIMQRYAASNTTNYNVAIGWDEDVRELKFGRAPENGSNNEISFSQEWMRITETGGAFFIANTQAGNSVIAGTSMVINNVSFTERTYPGEANTASYFNGIIDCGSY